MATILYTCYCHNVFYSEEERDACTHDKTPPDFTKCPFCRREWPTEKEST
ncbi:MAG: hypothetical protein L0Z49_14060 [Actinobacteria bacterium]|nr:hypothetical protein [Actinomycetota bacterium]